MKEPTHHLEVVVDLEDDAPVTAREMTLLADLLPELLKDLIALHDNAE